MKHYVFVKVSHDKALLSSAHDDYGQSQAFIA